MTSTPTLFILCINVGDHVAEERSSSAAKKAVAVLRIQLLCLSSRFSRRSRLSSASIDSALVDSARVRDFYGIAVLDPQCVLRFAKNSPTYS